VQSVSRQQIGKEWWMDPQRQDHGRWLRAVLGNPSARMYLHRIPFLASTKRMPAGYGLRTRRLKSSDVLHAARVSGDGRLDYVGAQSRSVLPSSSGSRARAPLDRRHGRSEIPTNTRISATVTTMREYDGPMLCRWVMEQHHLGGNDDTIQQCRAGIEASLRNISPLRMACRRPEQIIINVLVIDQQCPRD
jgi:hypothetical protein